jgi:hypothetical protein
MGDWKPDQTAVVPVPDKQVGLEKTSKVHLWTVPARVQGLWCGAGLLRGTSLQLTQRYQEFEGTLAHRQRNRQLEGRIAGATLRVLGGRAGELVLQADGDELQIAAAGGPLALAQGQLFKRAAAGNCD